MTYVDDAGTLGSGGRGDVRRGRRRDNGETVAIKLLRDAHLPNERQAFAQEIALLSLRLPGMIPIYAANLNTAKPFYMMPFMGGGQLTIHAGKLAPGQLWSVVDFVAATLANLHARSHSHGDIKPDNILLDEAGRLACADPSTMGGTPGYWAPEVKNGNPVSPESDIFSFGATLFHLVTGLRPEDGATLDIFPFAPSELWLRNLILSCCHHNPQLRPTAAQIVQWRRAQKGVETEIKKVLVVAGVAGLFCWFVSEMLG